MEIDIKTPGLHNNKSYPALLLVVDDTDYHRTVPVLLGTNVLKTLLEDIQSCHGVRFLQEAQLKVILERW